MSGLVVPFGARFGRWVSHPVAFYLGIPLTIAVLLALMRSGLAALMPAPEALFFWIALYVPIWLASSAFARVAYVVLRPWQPPLWLICTIGAVTQALLFSPAYRSFHRWAQDTLTTLGSFERQWPLPAFTFEYAAALAWAMVPSLALFIGAHYFYDRVLGVPKYRYDVTRPGRPPSPALASDAPVDRPRQIEGMPDVAPSEAPAPRPDDTTARPPLLRQSRLPETATLYAVSAEEHYVQLFSDAGTDLVRYRFSDALDELVEIAQGMQVHRSWWVRVDLARRWHLRGRLLELEFDRGLRVPISLAFREAALLRAPADVRARARHHSRRAGTDSRKSSTGNDR